MAIQQFTMTRSAPTIWLWAATPKPAMGPPKNIPAAYKATWLLSPDHPDIPEINRILGELAMAEFGTYEGKSFPLEPGDNIANANPTKDFSFLRGKFVLQASSKVLDIKGNEKMPPRLLVYDKATGKYNRFTEPHERAQVKGMFYSGVETIGQLAFSTYAGFGGGVTAYLNEIVSFNVGDKIVTGVDDNERYGDAAKYVGHLPQGAAAGPIGAGPIGAHPTAAPHPAGGPLTSHMGTSSPINPMAGLV